jgi:hypothetical protein
MRTSRAQLSSRERTFAVLLRALPSAQMSMYVARDFKWLT